MEERTGHNGVESVNLLVLGALSFPRSNAANSRTLGYGKGILLEGGKVTVLCLRTAKFSNPDEPKIQPSGVFEGIKYIYSSGITETPKYSFLRIVANIKGTVRAFGIIWGLNRKQRINAVLFYGTSVEEEVLFIPVFRCLRIPVIRERGEYPFRDRGSFLKWIKASFYEKFICKLYDGMFIVTKFLESYSKPLLNKRASYIVVPALVDVSRFEGVVHTDADEKYIAYCGDPSGDKDGVPILIEAFSMIASKYPDLKLYIIGDSPNNDALPALKEQAKSLDIENRVVFTGRISREEIPRYLCNASVLALSRPTGIQSQGGFPCKLGEYLSTSNPVVVTDVGEIGEYLKDGESAFIAEPNSAEAFAEKLDYVFSHPELATKVALKGKQVAYANFNYKAHGKSLVDFILKLQY